MLDINLLFTFSMQSGLLEVLCNVLLTDVHERFPLLELNDYFS